MSHAFSIVVDRWNRRHDWDQRRKERHMPTTADILNAFVADLRGDTEHMSHEDLYVTDAKLDGDQVVVTFESFDGQAPFRARFALMQVELATSAELRQSEPAGA